MLMLIHHNKIICLMIPTRYSLSFSFYYLHFAYILFFVEFIFILFLLYFSHFCLFYSIFDFVHFNVFNIFIYSFILQMNNTRPNKGHTLCVCTVCRSRYIIPTTIQLQQIRIMSRMN